MTGGGDDKIYLNGLKANLNLLVNTGTGNDEVIVGGGEQRFNVTYPKSSVIYTVQQDVIQEKYLSQTPFYNDMNFTRRSGLSLADRQDAFRQFYKKWGKSDISSADLSRVTISIAHWNLLEANLAVALKLWAQAIELAVSPQRIVPLYNIDWSTLFSQGWSAFSGQTTALLSNMNAVEQLLQNTNSNRWWMQTVQTRTERYGFLNLGRRTIYSSYLYPALLNSYGPRMPDQVDFETLSRAFNSMSKFMANGRTLDQVFYQEYLRPVVAYTIYGDMIRAEQVRQGTAPGSARIAGWGYEPDLYKGDLYTHQIPAGGWMPHVSGEKDVWIDDWSSEGQGRQLFWDMVRMFYNIQTPAPDNKINIEQYFGTEIVTGAASYRFEDLPQRTVEKIMPASYDLSRIAGVVKISGGPQAQAGQNQVTGDTITFNIRNSNGATIALGETVLNLAEYTYDLSKLTPDSRLTHEDIQGLWSVLTAKRKSALSRSCSTESRPVRRSL